MPSLTILDDGRPTTVPYVLDGDAVRISAQGASAALGWSVEDRGLCCGGVCVPISDETLATEDGVSLQGVASALGRPLALDLDTEAAYVGVSAAERSAVLEDLRAPDFTLPDVDGRMHSLADHHGRKVLLVAWASW